MVITTPPPLCANGCGFYGSSKAEVSNSPKGSSPSSAAPDVPSVSVDSTSVFSPSKLNNRCESCNKKLGLMGFTCRCGKVFCQLHRYPSEHSCKYDFKKADRQVLAKQNPVIKGDKMKSRM
ncbi:hypothetical protein DITRI_Ditri06bG0112100 [Diplodiscus trichospermus]